MSPFQWETVPVQWVENEGSYSVGTADKGGENVIITLCISIYVKKIKVNPFAFWNMSSHETRVAT